MNRNFRYLVGSTLALLVTVAFSTANAATQAEVNKARAECHAKKLQVKARGSFARDEDRQAWETSCGQATALMDELGGKSTEVAAFEATPAPQSDQTTPKADPVPQSDQAPKADPIEPGAAPASAPANMGLEK